MGNVGAGHVFREHPDCPACSGDRSIGRVSADRWQAPGSHLLRTSQHGDTRRETARHGAVRRAPSPRPLGRAGKDNLKIIIMIISPSVTKALAEAHGLSPDPSSGAQAKDRRPPDGCVSSSASEWLSFRWPRLLSSGLRGLESGQSTAESAVYHGLCRPQAPRALFAGLPRGRAPRGNLRLTLRLGPACPLGAPLERRPL